MKVLAETVLDHNRKAAYLAYRDHLPQLVGGVRNVDRIEVHARDAVRGGLRLHNLWFASARIPVFARRLIAADELCWDDRAHWRDRQYACDWVLTLKGYPDYLECVGRHEFTTEGRKRARIHIEGELTVKLTDVPGVPRRLHASVRTQLEKWIASVMVKNLQQINESLDRFLEET